MGWKAVRDHYHIEHTVCVSDEGICIGSGYIHNIMVIDADGRLTKRYGDRFSVNEDLQRYQREMDADPEMLRRLALQPDTFEILEKQCEALGWPNVTHDGLRQYQNTFSADRAQVVAWALENADARVRSAREQITEAQQALEEKRARLKQAEAALANLKAAECGAEAGR